MCLMSPCDRCIEVRFSRSHLLGKRLYRGLLCFQLQLGAVAILLRRDTLRGKRNYAISVRLDASQVGLRLRQLRADRLQPGLSIGHVAGSGTLGRRFRRLGL